MSRNATAAAIGVTRRKLELAEHGHQTSRALPRAYDDLLGSMEEGLPIESGWQL